MLIVADASAFLNVFQFDFRHDIYYTTNSILDEIIDFKNKMIIRQGMESGRLRLSEPSSESLELIKSKTVELGLNLSKNDISILALALDFKKEGKNFILQSDDYSMQNLAFHLKIPFKAVSQKGIQKEIRFVNACPVCGKEFQANERTCIDCGIALARKKK